MNAFKRFFSESFGILVNPVRSFGPALFVGDDALKNVWEFLVPPLVGGMPAALVYRSLDTKEADEHHHD
jgi:aquaporin Z